MKSNCRIESLVLFVRCGWIAFCLPFTLSSCFSQERGTATEFPPVPIASVARYSALRTNGSIHVDGKLDESSWKNAPRSPKFVDLITGQPTIHDTQAAVLWDDEYLYVGYWIEEPLVQGKFTKRDSPIYEDNDVELFIAGADSYYELEINALGTLYEGLFVWQSEYERKGFDQVPELNQKRPGVQFQSFNGVGLTNHPRGLRWAYLGWDFPQLKSGVHVEGTINDSKDRDRGWTVELALPWSGMKALAMADQRSLPPQNGDVWRMDFSRFNQFKEAAPAKDSGGWAWSAHGVWDSHVPEVFPFITFSSQKVAND